MGDTVNSSTAAKDVLTEYQRKVPEAKDQYSKDTFLQIMVAQLKYQDPMEGMDNSQFVAQMAQFTALEQMQNLNTSFEKFASSFAELKLTQDVTLASMWMGKEVMVVELEPDADGNAVVTNGIVTGFAIEGDGLQLRVNGKPYYLGQVVAVKEADTSTGSDVKPDGGTDKTDEGDENKTNPPGDGAPPENKTDET